MVDNTSSLLQVLTLTTALTAPLLAGCTAPTVVGSDSSAALAGAHVMAFKPSPPAGTGGAPPTSSSTTGAGGGSWHSAGTGGAAGGAGGGATIPEGSLYLWFDSSDSVCDLHPDQNDCDPSGWFFNTWLTPGEPGPGHLRPSPRSRDTASARAARASRPSRIRTSPSRGRSEILRSDASGIELRLANVRVGSRDLPEVSGEYDAPVCPVAW